MKIKCVVSCRNAGGVPDFFPCEILCSDQQYNEGLHYEKADEFAELSGYEDCGLVYDENDGPEWLFKAFSEWPMLIITTKVP